MDALIYNYEPLKTEVHGYACLVKSSFPCK